MIGRVGDDPTGDALMVALARAGVGHVSVLRDPGRPTVVVPQRPADDDPGGDDAGGQVVAQVIERQAIAAQAPMLEPADVALGLEYLNGTEVIVVVDDTPPDVVPVVIEAADYTHAHLVILLARDATPPEGLGANATVLEVPDDDDDGAFAGVVGAYAAAIDAGTPPSEAFRSALRSAAWEPSDDSPGL